MFTTKGKEAQPNGTMSKYLSIGNHKLKINSIEAIKANSSDNYKVRFNVETEPINTPGFTPVEGHYGQIGRIDTVYLANDNQVSDFTVLIATLATKLGVKAQVDEVVAENVPSYVAAIEPLLKGEYFYGRVTGEEYESNGKVGTSLRWSKYGMFASIEEGVEKLKPVDPTNKYDLKKLAVNTSNSTVDTSAVASAF